MVAQYWNGSARLFFFATGLRIMEYYGWKLRLYERMFIRGLRKDMELWVLVSVSGLSMIQDHDVILL